MSDVESVASAAILRAQPGDIVFLECEDRISAETAERIHAQLHAAAPDVKFLLLSDGLHVVKGSVGEVREVRAMGHKWFTKEVAASLGIDEAEWKTLKSITIHATAGELVSVELIKVTRPQAVAS